MTTHLKNNDAAATRTLSPEDFKSGDYVCVMRRACEIPAIFTCREGIGDPESNFRVSWIPCEPKPPFLVSEICLPFILVKTYDRNAVQLDVRTVQLGRLSPKYARRVRRKLRRQSGQNRSSRRCF